jgi:hypothetical protein
MLRNAQAAQVLDADELLDAPTEPDDANEEGQSGALQEALLEGEEDDDEIELGMLKFPAHTRIRRCTVYSQCNFLLSSSILFWFTCTTHRPLSLFLRYTDFAFDGVLATEAREAHTHVSVATT